MAQWSRWHSAEDVKGPLRCICRRCLCQWPFQQTKSNKLTQHRAPCLQIKLVATQTKQSLPTFQQMSHKCKVEVGVKIESHKVVHLLAVPLQWPPHIHEDLFWALPGSQKCTGFRENVRTRICVSGCIKTEAGISEAYLKQIRPCSKKNLRESWNLTGILFHTVVNQIPWEDLQTGNEDHSTPPPEQLIFKGTLQRNMEIPFSNHD